MRGGRGDAACARACLLVFACSLLARQLGRGMDEAKPSGQCETLHAFGCIKRWRRFGYLLAQGRQ